MKMKTKEIPSFRQAEEKVTTCTCDSHFGPRSVYTYSKPFSKGLYRVQQNAFMLQVGFGYYCYVLCKIVTKISNKLFLSVNVCMSKYESILMLPIISC